jgi:hypothetical protein
MNQFLHSVPNSTAYLPTDIWLSSSATVKPQKSSKVAIWLFKNFNNNSIEASAEGYYKTMDIQVLFKEGSQIKVARCLLYFLNKFSIMPKKILCYKMSAHFPFNI